MEIAVYVFYVLTMAFVTITSIYLVIKDKDDRGSNYNAKCKYPNTDNWIKRTNRFNNQFIIQRVNGNEQMQCVTCGSSEVSSIFSYSDKSWATEKVYTCDKCGNTYTVKEAGQ